jgi:hypothetical protein
MTPIQIKYLLLFEAGHTVTEIAQMTGKSKSTISRTLTRTRNRVCPFSPDCLTCPLEDCAIREEYAFLLNGNDRRRNQHSKGGE